MDFNNRKPKIADDKPQVLVLEAGTYFWCGCGLSKRNAFCDGSHSASGFSPLAFTLEEKKKVALCQCKRSLKAPYCDGSHRKI